MCEHKYVSDFIAQKIAYQEQMNETNKPSKTSLENALKEANLEVLKENDNDIILVDSNNDRLIIDKEDKYIISEVNVLTMKEIKVLFELYKTEGWL